MTGEFNRWVEFTIRLGVALGLERQWRQRMADLRTNTLVATGAALFVMLSVLTLGDSSPTRVAAQVVSGIGFLAGGVILREGLTVRGNFYPLADYCTGVWLIFGFWTGVKKQQNSQ